MGMGRREGTGNEGARPPGSKGTGSLSKKGRTAATYSPAGRSTIGAGGLNFSVRDGKRWDPATVATFNGVT